MHRLLQFFPGLVDGLPPPQRDALLSTFGLIAAPPPDRFLVALAVLTLLADSTADAPLVAVVDDAQWLDLESGTVLGFVARRLQAERVVMLFAASGIDGGPAWLSRVPELVIGRLDDTDAADLLSTVTRGKLSPSTRARLLDQGDGNPLALIEMARELTPEQLAGEVTLPDLLPPTGSLRNLLAPRLQHLDPGLRLLLAVAAAEPTAPASLVWSAAQRLGVDTDATAALEGLVSIGDVVRFSHPLLRSVAYHSVPLPERQRVHRALAEVMSSTQHFDRVAWHLAAAATGPDEAVANKLEQAAQGARQRGGYAAATTLLQRAAALSAQEPARVDRLLAASEEALIAGQPDQAHALLEEVRDQATDGRQAAVALRLSGEALFATGATDGAGRELLAAAKAVMGFDASLGRQILLRALMAATFATSDVLNEVRSFASAFSDLGLSRDEPTAVADLFLSGFVHRLTGNPGVAAQRMRAALDGLERAGPSQRLQAVIPPAVAGIACIELIDGTADEAIYSSYIEFARHAGALTILPNALIALGMVNVRQGRFEVAEARLHEAQQLRRATGAPGIPESGVGTGTAPRVLARQRGRGDRAGGRDRGTIKRAEGRVQPGVGAPRGARLKPGQVPQRFRRARAYRHQRPARVRDGGIGELYRGGSAVGTPRGGRRGARPFQPKGHGRELPAGPRPPSRQSSASGK